MQKLDAAQLSSSVTQATVGLSDVDNTRDLAKPLSNAAIAALALKANAADVSSLLSNDLAAMSNAIALKANATDVSALANSVALKANASDVATSLGLKANASDVATSLGLKANASDVATSLSLKANASDVATSLSLKVNASAVSASVVANGIVQRDAEGNIAGSGGVQSVNGVSPVSGNVEIGLGTPFTQLWTSDGSTTVYALTHSTTQNMLLVTVDGVTQAPGVDYTVSGASLTLTTSVPIGLNITARLVGTYLVSGGNLDNAMVSAATVAATVAVNLAAQRLTCLSIVFSS